MIDAHTHLNSPKLFSDREKHVFEFEKIGGKALINTWADEEYNNNWLEISKKYKWNLFIKSTIWYHPFEVVVWNINDKNIDKMINLLEQKYISNKEHIVAIWEAGIDSHYDWDIKLELQKELFEHHCKLAEKLQLPLVIHSRDAFDETMKVLENYKTLKVYFHCWGYWKNEIQKIKNIWFKSYWIGFCGNITYPKAQEIRDSLLECDLENILIETDAPYLSPQELRGQTNYPKNTKLIYEYIAKEKNTSTDIIINQVSKNFEKLYK